MKILVAPGAFKHSLTAIQAAEAITTGLVKSGIQAEIVSLPIADGGNGTLDAFLANSGQRIEIPVLDPLGREIKAEFGLLQEGQTAVIEMALASGIELVADNELNPMLATTYGTGQLLQAALDAGATRFIIGMGGSATVDGGAGCLQALGVQLLNQQGESIPFGGNGLEQLAKVDTTNLDKRWQDVEIVIASDVENPTLGKYGAAAVFGPQKGADEEQVALLEQGLNHFFTVIYEQTNVDVRHITGGGAAGALSAGLIAFLGGTLESGIDLILAQNRFAEHLQDADLVITGEGQMDEQTVDGKGPFGVAQFAKKHDVPTVAIVGGLNAPDELFHQAGLQAVLPIMTKPMLLQDAIQNANQLVEHAAQRLGYLLQI